MGQEIDSSEFTAADFDAFAERLRQETELLGQWFREGAFDEGPPTGGLELEACLVDARAQPAGLSEPLLAALQDPLVVPELANFNLELNGTPQPLEGHALSRLAQETAATWQRCRAEADKLGARMVMIGILPALQPEHLTLASMAPRRRYRALNDQIFRVRRGRPFRLHIAGHDELSLQHEDVMLESAATSFQIHLKVRAADSARLYNASMILAAPMVAVSANSPFLFGCDLWAETRIPLFEQSVAVGGNDQTKRVTFGLRYLQRSILECFEDNLTHFPVLLPQTMDQPRADLAHLRLHNGTIWRWNRPLIGFDASGRPHLRVEHRVVPAGPTLPDMIANAALYFGAVHTLATDPEPPEGRLAFSQARANFYSAAQGGLSARIHWMDGNVAPVTEIIRHQLLPAARRGLERLGIHSSEIRDWLGIIARRVETSQTGAAWQRAYVERHDADGEQLTLAYLERQDSGLTVDQWPL